MPNCDLLEACIFFNDKMANMPNTAEVLKLKYCTNDSAECARFVVCKALGRGRVPADLFPSQLDKAMDIISRG